MKSENVETSTTVVTFKGQLASLTLHRKVVSNCSGSVTYEIERG